MKKILLVILPLLVVSYSFAQNTDWPSQTSTNSVGIGTQSPTAKLSIVTTTQSPLSFQANTGGAWTVGPNVGGGSGDDTFGIYSYTFGPSHGYAPLIQFNSNTGNALINQNGGFTGIGTSNPLNKLDVNGNISLSSNGSNVLRILQTVNAAAYSGPGTYSQTDMAYGVAANGKHIWIGVDGNTEIMRLDARGYLGIGTATPDQLLSVKGTIHSQTVLVDMIGWNDYVFEPNYKLPLLSDIKSYVEKNHHLPEIPSESEIVKQGLDLGKIDAIQTKKIEELTLYLIERDSQVSDQSKQIDGLKGDVDELKAQVKQLFNLYSKK